MEAKYGGLTVPEDELFAEADKELMKIRRDGVETASLAQARNLCLIASVVTPGGTSREELETLLKLLIARRYPLNETIRDELELTFGLHERTRHAGSTDRYEAARERHLEGMGEDLAENHYANEITRGYRKKLAEELCKVYAENRDAIAVAAQTAIPKPPANNEQERDSAPEKSVSPHDNEPRDEPQSASERRDSDRLLPVPRTSKVRVVPNPPVPRKTHRFGWGRRLAALALALIALVVVSIIGVRLFSGGTAHANHEPSLRRLAAEDDRLLPVAQTPLPGEASRTLGFGDEVGGRPMYAYAGNRNYTTITPTLDSLTDVPYHVGNERKFLHVVAVRWNAIHTAKGYPDHRSVALPMDGKVASIRVYVENSAGVLGPCMSPEPTVAASVRLRVAIWNSPDGQVHVVRAWLTARNTYPRWITDAIAITTPESARLVLAPNATKYWLQRTNSDYHFAGVNAMKPAGVAIGADGTGRIGSCWSEQQVYNLVFRPETTTH